jgi:2-keto-4-pentenoate hydratase/2-oxohepta-3-ene-1,7-dioic acid hydratase in catechol pathway
MKIARVVHDDETLWGIVDVDAGTIQPIVGAIAEWGPGLTVGTSEPPTKGQPVLLSAVQFLPPIEPTATIVGVGLNYWSHLHKLGVTERPERTIGFIKPQVAMIGHEAEMAYSALTEQLDFEIELVAVIGSSDIDPHTPTDQVLGYTVGNDVSARDAPAPAFGGLDLFSIKALDRSTPLGPWIVTKDELGPIHDPGLEIELRVNGERRQHDDTSNMLWNVDECLQYVLDRIPLRVGDVLYTGTTDGVGMEDGRFLQPGDVVEAEIHGIGVLRNTVGPHEKPKR